MKTKGKVNIFNGAYMVVVGISKYSIGVTRLHDEKKTSANDENTIPPRSVTIRRQRKQNRHVVVVVRFEPSVGRRRYARVRGVPGRERIILL